jgi:hypothetical protein
MFYTIYKITNKINNKYYIGKHQTINLDDGYMGSGVMLNRAIKKYGIDNFTKEILHIFDNEAEMNATEKQLVVISEETYNLCEGGMGGFGYINRTGKNIYENHGILAAKNARATLQRKRLEDENYNQTYLENMRNKSAHALKVQKEKYPNGTWDGKKHKEETKRKIGEKNSLSQSGSKNSQFGTCWITNGQENKKIKKDELDHFIGLGYKQGRIL